MIGSDSCTHCLLCGTLEYLEKSAKWRRYTYKPLFKHIPLTDIYGERGIISNARCQRRHKSLELHLGALQSGQKLDLYRVNYQKKLKCIRKIPPPWVTFKAHIIIAMAAIGTIMDLTRNNHLKEFGCMSRKGNWTSQTNKSYQRCEVLLINEGLT